MAGLEGTLSPKQQEPNRYNSRPDGGLGKKLPLDQKFFSKDLGLAPAGQRLRKRLGST